MTAPRAATPDNALSQTPAAGAVTASHAGSGRRWPLRRCRQQVMPAARIRTAGIVCRPCQWLARAKGLGQEVARTACRITFVTVPGLEIMDRCDASTLVIWACAVLAMASCNASGMAWSTVPTTAQDGMVFHAGTPVCWVSAIVDSGSWVTASTLASVAGRPLAMQLGDTLCLM